MKAFFAAIKNFFARTLAAIEYSESKRLEEYLSQAQDVYQLEYLQRQWDSQKSRRGNYF